MLQNVFNRRSAIAACYLRIYSFLMVLLAVLKHHEINGICCEVKKALSKQELDRAGGSSRGGGESVRVEGRGLGGSERVMRTDVDIFGISDYRGRLLVRTVYRRWVLWKPVW